MITIHLQGTEAFVRKSLELQRAAKETIVYKLRKLSELFAVKTTGTAVNNYLSGPRPDKLGRVTGRLASSIARGWKVQPVGDKHILITFGTDVPYAPIHEYGGTIHMKPRTANLFIKEFKSGKRKGKKLFSKEGKASYGMQRKIGGYDITIPPRPFLHPAFNDNHKFLVDGIMEILRQECGSGGDMAGGVAAVV